MALLALQPGFPATVLVAHHQSISYRSRLAELLSGVCRLPVRDAVPLERLRPGVILLAPHGRHLIVTAGDRIAVPDEPPTRFVRPSADRLFTSLARVCGPRVIAIVLSGAGRDGASGILAVKQAGGTVIVQDVPSAPFRSMPEAAIRTGVADRVLAAADMPTALFELIA